MAISHPPLGLSGRVRPYVLGHRGNRAHCPENTLSSFRRAFQDGADLIETDLHLTRDGAIVCIHDPTVDRTTDGTGPVATRSLAELRTLNAAARRPDLPAEPVPTLAEVAALIPSDRGLALELKAGVFSDPRVLHRLTTTLGEYDLLRRTILLSFSRRILAACRRHVPDLPTGQVSFRRFFPGGPDRLMGPAWPLMFLNPFYTLAAKAHGQMVCPLDPTPNARLGLYLKLGCHALLADDPGSTVQALGRPLDSGDCRIFSPTTDAELAAGLAIRYQLLRAPWGQPRGSERDPLDAAAVHALAVTPSGTPIGTARLHTAAPGRGQIRFMAVLPAFQGLGIGARLTAYLEDRARAEGLARVVLDARLTARSFYERQGYQVMGDAHTLFGSVANVRMEKALTPAQDFSLLDQQQM